jgi:hypothetical protein
MRIRRILTVAIIAFMASAMVASAVGEVGNMKNDKSQVEGGCQKTLRIRWLRLLSDGKTCPRCSSTGEEIEKAVSSLSQSLAPLKISVMLKKDELSEAEFKKNPLQSNQIWLNGKRLEDWIGAKTGQSKCCDTCGTSDCKTVSVGESVYETVPAELVIKAGLLAASEMISCAPKTSGSNCCPK